MLPSSAIAVAAATLLAMWASVEAAPGIFASAEFEALYRSGYRWHPPDMPCFGVAAHFGLLPGDTEEDVMKKMQRVAAGLEPKFDELEAMWEEFEPKVEELEPKIEEPSWGAASAPVYRGSSVGTKAWYRGVAAQDFADDHPTRVSFSPFPDDDQESTPAPSPKETAGDVAKEVVELVAKDISEDAKDVVEPVRVFPVEQGYTLIPVRAAEDISEDAKDVVEPVRVFPVEQGYTLIPVRAVVKGINEDAAKSPLGQVSSLETVTAPSWSQEVYRNRPSGTLKLSPPSWGPIDEDLSQNLTERPEEASQDLTEENLI